MKIRAKIFASALTLGFALLAHASLPPMLPPVPTEAETCPIIAHASSAVYDRVGELPVVSSADADEDLRRSRELALPLENARNRAWKLHPHDALARGAYIQQAMDELADNLRWHCAIQIDPKGRNKDQPLFRSSTFRELVSQNHPGLNTIQTHSRHENPQSADALVVALHGVGSSYSNSGTMLNAVNFLGSQRTTGMKADLRQRLAEGGVTMARVYAEALDLPFHGGGPEDPRLDRLDALADWLAIRLRELRSFNKPILLYTRSSSVNLALAVAERHPELVDGFLIMSGNFPTPRLILYGDNYAATLYRTSPDFRLNYNGTRAASYWEWDSALRDRRQGTILGNKPRVFWIGENDAQTPRLAVDLWREFAGTENVVYVRGAGHDVMPFTEDQRPTTVQRLVEGYRVIDRTVAQFRSGGG